MFWEIESTPSLHETPIVRIGEQLALKKVEKSITFRNEMYRVGVPWICNEIVLPNNYNMALQRLENTEKRLERSPDIAQFVLQQHAKKYQSEYPRAAETISKSTYMDDSMDSVLNEEQGVALYKELSALLAKAGLHARKWLSSSSRFLQEIPQMDRKSEVDLDKESLATAKTLGVWW